MNGGSQDDQGLQTATCKNGKISIGDKAIFVPYDSYQKAWFGKVVGIYRIGNSSTFVRVSTPHGEERIYAHFIYRGELPI